MLLEVQDLVVSYGEVEAVHGVSFRVEEGELVSIIGANGAGKSSILRTLMGLQAPTSGAVRFLGEDVTGEPAHIRARRGIRMVPERARVFPQLTVKENLLMGVYGLRKALPYEERLRWLYGLFPILEERGGQFASTLSGGEQQQLAIARALVSNPKLLLVDEVSMGLMPKLVDQVFSVLQQLNREQGLSILLVEQNALASLQISRRAYILETGRLALEGEARSLLEDPRVREAYLGL
ncbi:ABC transporter ATP-binding protein [Aminomonas paucivorans]|uniref:Amino acid/amide ABC transporter ATP-binding protein 2, HAAT family n=1 Tax=Aminomonas paucivorans DSM 12260 TaxID=584708 RepID=E3D0N9_9BACT|nr:ABC transporter ATP-binding protein [Aminomonas paucivorans]EFQ23860.1 amino acid/amide ABC transporter ATP-binding protein 2, HAAT family [Aminomonas paucivorans DSM 12260]